MAAIGFTFYTGKMFPPSYQNAALIAQHLKAATGVTLVGDTAFVLVERARAVAVPYSAK